MKYLKLFLVYIFIALSITSCTSDKSVLNTELKNDFTKAMNAYQNIWRTNQINKAKELANNAFSDQEIINQVITSYKTNLEYDQGIDYAEKNYDISVVKANKNNATLKVKANLKGYPITLSTGEKIVKQKQDFSFGPHDFEMKKEQGLWKISKF